MKITSNDGSKSYPVVNITAAPLAMPVPGQPMPTDPNDTSLDGAQLDLTMSTGYNLKLTLVVQLGDEETYLAFTRAARTGAIQSE